MAACPNCQSQVIDGQLFCRSCGYCLDTNFQLSTRSLGLPGTVRAENSSGPPPYQSPRRQHWRGRFVFPLAGFLIALMMGSTMMAFLGTAKPIPIYPQVFTAPFSERAYMGVYLINSNHCYSSGSYIEEVVADSPAEYSGLIAGDQIIAINGQAIEDVGDVVSFMERTGAGSRIDVKVKRDGAPLTVSLSTVRRRDLQLETREQGFLGVSDLAAVPLPWDVDSLQLPNNTEYETGIGDKENWRGVHVGEILEDSAAEQAGLQEGDIIFAIDGHPTRTPEELSRRVRAVSPQQMANIAIQRAGETLQLNVIMGHRD
ncbi:MAG: PDZ domain-containing protein [Acidobacteriota bacterium]